MEDDSLGELNCDVCGTVMHPTDGGFRCRGCGWMYEVEWIERPKQADRLPGVHGG